MRLLVVTERFDLVGGSERYAGAVARELARRGHELRVLCAAGDQAGGLERVELPALAAPRLAPPERDALRAAARAAAADVALHLSGRNVDAFELLLGELPVVRFVQDHTLFCPGLDKLRADATPCARPLGSACLGSYWLGSGCHGFRPRGPRSLRWPLRQLAARRRELALCRRAARLLVASEYMRAELRRSGLPEDRVALLRYFAREPAPAAPDALAALDGGTRAFVERDGPPLLLAPARLVLPDKGVDVLLDALALLERPFRALVAGDGPARAELERRAAAAGLSERVRFAGWLAPAALDALYERCDLVVHPAVWDEPFGLVGLEAMAHARAVVAFRVGGVPEWLTHGTTGLLAPRGDRTALAAAIGRLLADPRARARMGAAGRGALHPTFARARHLEELEAHLAAAARTLLAT